MSAGLYRARKRVKALGTEWLNGVDFVMVENVIAIMDEEMLREAEASYFQPFVKAEPPTTFNPDSYYASEQEMEN